MPSTILVSDDEPSIGHALRREFAMKGIDVVIDTDSGVYELAKALQPSAILLDLLQGRDGLSLLKALKADPSTRRIPVVIMSALFASDHPSEQELPAAVALGAFSVVAKPFPEQFVERVAALARSAGEMFPKAPLVSVAAFETGDAVAPFEMAWSDFSPS